MRRLASILLGLFCAACAHLNAQVDIVDPRYVEAQKDPAGDTARLNLVLNQPPEEMRRIMESSRAALFDDWDRTAAALRSAAARPGARDAGNLIGAAASLEQTAKKIFSEMYYDPAERELTMYYTEISSRFFNLSRTAQVAIMGGSQRVPDNLRTLVDRRMLTVLNYIRNLNVERQKQDVDVERLQIPEQQKQDVRQTQAAAQTQADETSRSLFGPSGSLVASKAAYIVASAPPSAWQFGYNRAVVDGRLGNLSTAIKLESLADFRVKGVTFDPSTVAQVASKVSTQSLLVAAQIAGVPVIGQGADMGTGQALAQSSSLIAKAEKTLSDQRAYIQDYRAALVDIGQAILRETPAIQGPMGNENSQAAMDARAAAITAIKATVDAQLPRLAVPESMTTP
jgi:hypothetical protein